jgi:hypothetical protein
MSDSRGEDMSRNKRQNSGQSGPDGAGTQSGLPWPVLILAALALTALLFFVWTIGARLMGDGQKDADARLSPAGQQTAEEQDAALAEPISILPEMPEGTTIMEKQPDASTSINGFASAPVAQGADIASGYAVDLGKGLSFLELSKRFASIVEENGPENFRRLEPRAILIDTVTGLEARLLVGPFETERAASEACEVLLLPDQLGCKPTQFEGELIARQ